MEVFVRNIPESCSQKEYSKFFAAHLKALGIYTFSCHKFQNKHTGTLTLLEEDGVKFLAKHGDQPPSFRNAVSRLTFHGRVVRCVRSRNTPNAWEVRTLTDPQETISRGNHDRGRINSHEMSNNARFTNLWCGFWSFVKGRCVFVPVVEESRHYDNLGHISIDSKHIEVERHTGPIVRIRHGSVNAIYVDKGPGRGHSTGVTFVLQYAPMFLQVSLSNRMATLLSGSLKYEGAQYSRATHLLETRRLEASGYCFVYQLRLTDAASKRELTSQLRAKRSLPLIQELNVMVDPATDFDAEFAGFLGLLRSAGQYGFLPFAIKFQIHRIVAHGFMRPSDAALILEFVPTLLARTREFAVIDALKKLTRVIPYAGPEEPPGQFEVDRIKSKLEDLARKFIYSGSEFEHARRHKRSMGLIHRVYVTPAGVYPQDAVLETKNRVIRKFSTHSDNFIRVIFADEDFQKVSYDRNVDRSDVFDRFRNVLSQGLFIGGHNFQFLGFSHSSLRSSQCWFMSPFKFEGVFQHPVNIISDLGDFSTIRSPAKCAARIGQAFSDTAFSIAVEPSHVTVIEDIERNARVFSDGIGTISEQLLQDVWRVTSKAKRENATILQIRFQGAKGVLSLDSRLQGRRMCLRASMIKYSGSRDSNLEICDGAYRPLPMHLNRYFIKILEDLGVPAVNILNLQQQALEEVRETTRSNLKTPHFLEVNHIGTAVQLPQLITLLNDVDCDYRRDRFLRDIADMGAAVKIRDLKYRGRIPVPEAYTLFGVLDETGLLAEHEIYVAIRDKNGTRRILKGMVLVTRAPALHPGDIQPARCVQVPPGSALEKLYNCVVFSQKGTRDLPSKLSGGDLDGDLFSVIFDRKLWPRRRHEPAGYPRASPIDIKRAVKTEDMTEFFVKFMETDMLGHICTSHLICSDQYADGTLDPRCIKLAEMASIAVDYSKTGIPVNMSESPADKRSMKFRPDFMAEKPRLVLNAKNSFEQTRQSALFDLEHDEDRLNRRYYRSNKVLGQLYRAIDEEQFIAEVQRADLQYEREAPHAQSLMQSLLAYVLKHAVLVQWDQHMRLARDIRDVYENEVIETASQYCDHTRQPLSEKEVFAGIILGRDNGMLDKRIRDTSTDMQERVGRLVRYVTDWIVYGDGTAEDVDSDGDFDGSEFQPSASDEALPRSIACLNLAVTEQGPHSREMGCDIQSFKYIVAVVCLKQLKLYLGRNTMPPMTTTA